MDLCFFGLPCSAPKVVGLLRLVGWSARATGALLDFWGLSFPSDLARQDLALNARVVGFLDVDPLHHDFGVDDAGLVEELVAADRRDRSLGWSAAKTAR